MKSKLFIKEFNLFLNKFQQFVIKFRKKKIAINIILKRKGLEATVKKLILVN